MSAVNNNTRRYPRTLKEAFGPYTDDSYVEPMPEPRSVHPSTWFILACGIAGLLITWWTR